MKQYKNYTEWKGWNSLYRIIDYPVLNRVRDSDRGMQLPMLTSMLPDNMQAQFKDSTNEGLFPKPIRIRASLL